MRKILLSLGCLVILAGLSGCIGQDGIPGSTEINENVSCTELSKTGESARSLGPGQSISAETNISEGPANASIELSTEGSGTIDLELTRGDQTLWEDSYANTGSGSFDARVTDIEAGGYTLTASTETGIYSSVELSLQISYHSCTRST